MRVLQRDDAWYRSRLASPRGSTRVVIDTDAANEIDDQFALTWALLSPERLRVEAVYAAPFSFEHRRREMIRARAAQQDPAGASEADLQLLRQHLPRLDHFDRMGWTLETVDLPVFNAPAQGMERSYDEIVNVFDKLHRPIEGQVFRGSAGYLLRADQPLRSEAVDHLVCAARAAVPEEPLYVVAIGCLTNIASALLIAPDIVDLIVVIWTSGYPSCAPHVNDSFNLEQDMLASTVVLDSGVPLVYLPGYQVGAQLRLSLPEVERYVRGRGAIGDYLHHLFTHNPLWGYLGTDERNAYSWVIWDMINIAWLIDSRWLPSELVRTPCLGADRRWQRGSGRHLMREAYAVDRDALFGDFFRKLETAPL